MPQNHSLLPSSRRSFLHLSAAASATAAFGIVTEPMLAWAEQSTSPSSDAVMINSNENPLGPCEAALAAMSAILPKGGRYQRELTDSMEKTFAQVEGVKAEYVTAFPGSSSPLHYTVMAFASPTRSYVTADPGYEAGLHAAKVAGARVVKVGLTKTYAHDVKAMLGAAPDAGVFYVCTPNNPTGTLTPHSDIEYLVANKPKESIVLVDEAYIHFSNGNSVIDLVKVDKDVIVLRTFSKIYGMAGLRCGFAIGKPELLSRIDRMHGWNAMPVTAVVAAVASLKDGSLVGERRQINAGVRQETFEWLDRNRYSYIPSEANFFMLDTRRPAKDVIKAMAHQDIFIGRNWPVMPTYARITVGTLAEMERFQAAFKKVMDGTAVGRLGSPRALPETLDGLVLRG